MTRLLLFAMLVFLQPAAASAQDLRYVGDFHNVSSNDGGEHCGGYSLALWSYRGSVIGLLDVHTGLCGDPPCGLIRDARLNPATGQLEFWSSVGARKIEFKGTLAHASVDGMIDGNRVHLARDQDEANAEFKGSLDLPAWCKFWTSVPRCGGVREFCRSIDVNEAGTGR